MPRTIMANKTEISKAIVASPVKEIILFNKELPGKKLLAITERAINITGNNARIKLSKISGRSFAAISIFS
jgi:hypothetical protein